MEENILTVTIDNEGNYIDIRVIDFLEDNESNKTYIVYNILNDQNEEVYISILDEKEDSYTLRTIEDEEELKMINEFYDQSNIEMGE